MKFLKNRETGEYVSHDAMINDPEERAKYDIIYDYKIGYLKKINDRLGWILFIIVATIVCNIIAYYYSI